MKFIKIIEDKKYPKKNSQTGEALGKWEWALTNKKQIYYSGIISGMGDEKNFQKLGNTGFGCGIPLDTSDVLFLADFVKSV